MFAIAGRLNLYLEFKRVFYEKLKDLPLEQNSLLGIVPLGHVLQNTYKD